MKLKSIQLAILIAVCLLTRGTYQEESDATGNKDEISIKDISDDPVETKTELAVDAVPSVDEKSVESGGDTAGAAADLSAPEPIKEADVIQQATELLEKNAEKSPSNVEEVKEPEKVVEAEKQPVDETQKSNDESLKIKSDQEVEQKEKPLEESEVKEETEAEVAELNQPNAVKQQAEPEPEPEQQKEEAPKQVGSVESKSESQSSSETKTDVDYKDDDVQKPAEIRTNLIKDPYEEVKSSDSNKPAEVKSEPVKSGVSVASEQNVVKKPTSNQPAEPNIVTSEDNKPISGRINKFYIIVPGIVLVIVVMIVIAFIVYNYKKGYKPVSQDTRNPIYKAADTSAAQV